MSGMKGTDRLPIAVRGQQSSRGETCDGFDTYPKCCVAQFDVGLSQTCQEHGPGSGPALHVSGALTASLISWPAFFAALPPPPTCRGATHKLSGPSGPAWAPARNLVMSRSAPSSESHSMKRGLGKRPRTFQGKSHQLCPCVHLVECKPSSQTIEVPMMQQQGTNAESGSGFSHVGSAREPTWQSPAHLASAFPVLLPYGSKHIAN